jgi:hypothetical protein
MKNNSFGIDLTVFSNDIQPIDALISLAGQLAPWALKTMDKLKNYEDVGIIRCDNHYIFIDELEYQVNENKNMFA